MNVPFNDLKLQYESIKTDIDHAIQKCLSETSFIGGEEITTFENAFASFSGNDYCIGCANGTDAIEVLLKAHGIGPNDEVLVPAMTWISTAESVSSVGAKPVFVDIEEDYFTIDPFKLKNVITSATKAIIAVHLYGHPANMPEILKVAEEFNLKVIEDCAQAHGAEIDGKSISTWAQGGTFSFYPGKNLGAYGDAGGIVSNDKEIADHCRLITNHGQLTKHDHIIEGRNSRLDTLQAAILNVKLPHLHNWNQKRRECAQLYIALLSDVEEIQLPKIKENATHVFHLFVIKTSKRDELKQYLEKKSISCAIHYPNALPNLKCYSQFEADIPVANKIQNEILSLPIFPEMTKEQIEYVVKNIKEFFGC